MNRVSITGKVVVFNSVENPKRYIIARCVNAKLVYFSSWDSKETAEKIAYDIKGVVVDTRINE